MRAVAVLALLAGWAGCAELGVITDGSSVSYGRPSNGALVDGKRMPDKGEGFTTREVWRLRGNRFGTDEMIDMLLGISRRVHQQVPDVRLVIADLSRGSGGAAYQYHRSHQSGRDVDLLYFMRDAEGKPFEADAMHYFDRTGKARDKTGITVDVPRTWILVRELVDAPEATVQFIFMYEPIAQMLIEHAKAIGEPEDVIARARRALKQPGDSARHDDHMHVRIYCALDDRQFGCLDSGPMDLLAEREAKRRETLQAIADALPVPRTPEPRVATDSATTVWGAQSAVTTAAPASLSFSSLLRAR